MWKRETVLVLNPKKGQYSELVRIPVNEIETASKIEFKIQFPPKSKNDQKPGSENQKPEITEESPAGPPRKRTKLSSYNSEQSVLADKPKRNRTKLNGTCLAVMEVGTFMKSISDRDKS